MAGSGYDPEYNPTQADYVSFQGQLTGEGIGGLIALAALAAIGIGAYATGAAAVEVAADTGIVVNGTTYYGVTEAEALIIDSLGEGEISADAAELLETLGQDGTPPWGLDAAAMLALDAYDDSDDADDLDYMDNFVEDNYYNNDTDEYDFDDEEVDYLD